MTIINVSQEDFESEVKKEDTKIVIVDFSATWCIPCVKLGEVLEEVSSELQVNIISWDYAGYGKHKLLDNVKPSEENVYADAEQVFNFVTIQADASDLPVVVYGRSLGSAPAIYITTKFQERINGLIVESGFRSISRVVSDTLHTLFDMFDNESLIKQQRKVPTMFVHGEKDNVVPFEHGKHLHELCACEKKYNFWIPNGHHNDLDSTYREELFIRLRGFIDRLKH